LKSIQNNITLSKTIVFKEDDEMMVLQLKGMVYHRDFYFTSYIVSSDGAGWCNDDMTIADSVKNMEI